MLDDAPLLLIQAPLRPADARVRLPEGHRNLFDRIIRDPKVPNRPARERLCTEMLCAVLANAPSVRAAVLRSFAELAGVDVELIATLDWDFETERAIGTKRDDLRIEGWNRSDENARRAVLWTVEVKVNAPLHLSGEQDLDDEGDRESTPEVVDFVEVSQLVNYDRWLSKEDALHRSGFVLSVRTFAELLPDELTMPWFALTWTQLARIVENELAEERIPDSELMIAEHFAGFVRDHLWSDSNMDSDRFEFDDLAILRAFAIRGAACFRKTNALVGSLKETVAAANLPFVSVTAHHALRGPSTRSAINGKLMPDTKGKPTPPSLYAGVVGGELCVWLESSPNSPAKAGLYQLAQKHIAALQARNDQWVAESSNETWPDLTLSRRLDFLLTADDQQLAMQDFVRRAIDDLEVAGFISDLRHLVERLSAPT